MCANLPLIRRHSHDVTRRFETRTLQAATREDRRTLLGDGMYLSFLHIFVALKSAQLFFDDELRNKEVKKLGAD